MTSEAYQILGSFWIPPLNRSGADEPLILFRMAHAQRRRARVLSVRPARPVSFHSSMPIWNWTRQGPPDQHPREIQGHRNTVRWNRSFLHRPGWLQLPSGSRNTSTRVGRRHDPDSPSIPGIELSRAFASVLSICSDYPRDGCNARGSECMPANHRYACTAHAYCGRLDRCSVSCCTYMLAVWVLQGHCAFLIVAFRRSRVEHISLRSFLLLHDWFLRRRSSSCCECTIIPLILSITRRPFFVTIARVRSVST